MVNDIEKLHQVVDTLEEHSSRVNEFNGVLSAVNSAREQIESTKELLTELVDEQKGLVSESHRRFEEYGARLTKLESLVASLGEIQNKVLKEIAVLDFVTPEQHEQGRAATEKAVAEKFAALAEKIDEASAGQQSTIKLLLGEIQNKVLKEIAALDFVTPEQHEQGRAATEKAVAEKFAALAEKIDEASAGQQSTIKSLQTIVVFGLLALAAGIAFLAWHALM
jgi:hypothetical protein